MSTKPNAVIREWLDDEYNGPQAAVRRKARAAHVAALAADTSDLSEFIRNLAWQKRNIPYNPDATFPKYARAHDLGIPLTSEFDVRVKLTTYRCQGFAGGIVLCELDKWGDTRHIAW